MQNNTENKIKKPITMVINETRISIVDIINNSGLPPFIIVPMMKELTTECIGELEILSNQEAKQYQEKLKQDVEETSKK